MELFCSILESISCCAPLLVHSTYHATAEDHIWTPLMAQHIRRLDLAHVLGGGNLFREVAGGSSVRMTTQHALWGCHATRLAHDTSRAVGT